MNDVIEREHRDDAPVTTSKTRSPDRTLVAQAVTINRPAAELFAFYRDFANLPRFMDNIERIDVLDTDRSHWVVKAPAGRTVEWTARVTQEEPGRSISWQSEADADIANSGRITFEEVEGRGTVVRAVLAYDPPAGLIGRVVAKLFQREPAVQARRDLRRFKQLMETGEVATGARNRRQIEEEGKN